MTAKTPVYQLEYLVQGESARNTRAALENNAKSIEAALIAGGVAAPGAGDLLAVSGRVSVLESDKAARPFAVLTGAGNVNLPHNTPTVLPLTGPEEADPLGGHSLTVNTSRWTCPPGWAGWYWLLGTVRIDTGTGIRRVGMRRNGVDIVRSVQTESVAASGAYLLGSMPALVQLAVGDYVEVFAFQDSGATISLGLASASMTVERRYAA